MTTFTTIIEDFKSALWGGHIAIPLEASAPFEGTDRRVVCTLNGEHSFQCALMHKGDGSYFINVNKATRKKLNLRFGAKVTVELKKDESKYGLPMPEEMKELLELDDEGDKYFHALTPGKQRSLLHIIGKPKSSNIRIKKALVVVDYLKFTKGKLDFKELNEAFKNANN